MLNHHARELVHVVSRVGCIPFPAQEIILVEVTSSPGPLRGAVPAGLADLLAQHQHDGGLVGPAEVARMPAWTSMGH